jgi:hypothetical protein
VGPRAGLDLVVKRKKSLPSKILDVRLMNQMSFLCLIQLFLSSRTPELLGVLLVIQ